MTSSSDSGRSHHMTAANDRVGSVRIDRLVLRGVDLDMHEAASLPARIAAELKRRLPTDASNLPPAARANDVALHVAHRIAAEVRTRGGEQ